MGAVLSRADLKQAVKKWRAAEVKTVLTNGCFDLLHAGHLRTFREAKKMGDLLIVGINSDTSVRKIKGDRRPLIAQGDRAELVAALEPVDFVIVFTETTVDSLLETIKPDIYVKGGDYNLDILPEKDTLFKLGTEVRFIPLIAGISTTEIINRARNL